MAQPGRPRSFNREKALQSAMEVFWALGYEGAILEDLQIVMGGITAPSFYAAFGSKEKLFLEAVELYRRTVGILPMDALTQSATARAAIEAMLRAAADCFCRRDKPHGCLIVLGTMNCSRASSKVQKHLLTLRLQRGEQIKRRLERGVAEGDLPADADVPALASFYTAVLLGICMHARDGASRKALMAAAGGAMAAWDNLVEKRNSPGATGKSLVL